MAHFAQLDENNVVINVIVVSDEDCVDDQGNESEAVGVEFCKGLFGQDTIWKQCSYNGNIRQRFAVIDGTYNPEADVFIAPKLFDSWVMNEETWQWEAPIELPEDAYTVSYYWDEDAYQADNTQGWKNNIQQ